MSSRQDFFGFNWFNAWYTSPSVFCAFIIVRYSIMEVISNSICSMIAIETLLNSKFNLEKMTKFVKILGEHRHCGTLCMDSRNEERKNDPSKPIEFVKRIQYSFGTVSLEDNSYPNSHHVLDELQDPCTRDWTQQPEGGTVSVALTEINALKLSWKMMNEAIFILLGGGVSSTTCSDSQKFIVFGMKGELHRNRVSGKEGTANGEVYEPIKLSECTNKTKNAVVGAGVLVTPPFPCGKV